MGSTGDVDRSGDAYQHEDGSNTQEFQNKNNAKKEVSFLEKVRERSEELQQREPTPASPTITNSNDNVNNESLTNKTFIGGYRNKNTGIEYHHAFTQTPPPPVTDPEVLRRLKIVRNERDTQTFHELTRSTQCTRETGTQMSKTGVYTVDNSGDKILWSRPYFSSDALFELKLDKIIQIQTFVRGWLARKRAGKLKAELDLKRKFIAEQAELNEILNANKQRSDIERRRNPTTKQDFAILYSELENWVNNEKNKLEAMDLAEEERKQKLKELLNKETQLLQTIDRLKIKANKANKSQRTETALKEMASSKKWTSYIGGTEEVTKVHTPFTIRTKELRNVYQQLSQPLPTLDERLEALSRVKWIVEEFDCLLTRDIVELIDREYDLLNRGRPEKSLVGLRQRLCNLFLQFIETPEFNPEAARLQKVPILRSNTQPAKPSHVRTRAIANKVS